MAYSQGVVSVGTAATAICTPGPSGALVQNLGTAALYLGAASVTAGTAATGGVSLPASMTTPALIPTGMTGAVAGDDEVLYGRVASGTNNVAFLGAV